MRNWRKEVQAFLVLMGPGTFWLVAFFLVPVALIWIYSFLDRGPQGQLEWVFSFDNYLRALEPIHLGIMWKSLWIAALSTALCLLLGFPDGHGRRLRTLALEEFPAAAGGAAVLHQPA